MVRFSTTEGTWLSLDVSPDGQTIVFDLLGDLYTVPVSGGRAQPITSGPAFDGNPRFSPDGRHLAFVSDRDGAPNLWVMDRDGRNARRLSALRSFAYASTVSSPAWSPDGRTVIVSQRVGAASTRSDRGEEDFFLGGIMFNYVFCGLVFLAVVVGIVIFTWPEVPWDFLQWGGIAFIAVLPFFFYPFSLTTWLASDILIKPVTDEEMEWHHASKEGEFRRHRDR